MDLATLRSELEAVLTDELGTYTLANGLTTPACSVRREGEGLFPGTKVAGLEVVVYAEPRLIPVNQYVNQPARAEWSVFLVGWDATADLQAAAEAVIYAFPGTVYERIPVPQGVGPANQARLVVQSTASDEVLVPIVQTGGLPRSFVIVDPLQWQGESFGVARVSEPVTLSRVWATVVGDSSPSVTFELRYDADRTATGTLATVNTEVTSTTSGVSVAIGQMPIAAGDHLWCKVTAASGNPTKLEVTLET